MNDLYTVLHTQKYHIFYVSDFHPGNRGSKPLGDAIFQARLLPGFFLSGVRRLLLAVLSHVLLSTERSRHTADASEVALGMPELNRS